MTGITFQIPERPRDYHGEVYRPDGLRGACIRVQRQGEARTYSDAHLVARWVLGLLHPDPVVCRRCAVTDYDANMHAALDWESAAPAGRLRVDRAGKIFSARPDLDYIPLCASCHKRHDTWRKALPPLLPATTI